MAAVSDPVNHPLICDTAVLTLLNDTTFVDEYCTPVIVTTDGYCGEQIPAMYSGQSFIVGIRYRNTLHVFSDSPVLMNNSTVTVDLTVPQNCCGNTKVISGIAFAASGEIGDSFSDPGIYDGIIEAGDFGIMENSVYNADSGYVITDLTGDGIVDTNDYIIEANNVSITMIDCHITNCIPLTTGMKQTEFESLSLYPNPAHQTFSIRFRNPEPSIEIRIMNSVGKICKSTNASMTRELKIDCSDLSPGLYHVMILSNGKMSLRKIVIAGN